MSRNDNGGSVLLAFFVGAVTGAAVALLFAPAPGDETRQFLGEKAREGRQRATAAARQGREVLKRERDQIVSAIEQGRSAYQRSRQPEGQPPEGTA